MQLFFAWCNFFWSLETVFQAPSNCSWLHATFFVQLFICVGRLYLCRTHAAVLFAWCNFFFFIRQCVAVGIEVRNATPFFSFLLIRSLSGSSWRQGVTSMGINPWLHQWIQNSLCGSMKTHLNGQICDQTPVRVFNACMRQKCAPATRPSAAQASSPVHNKLSALLNKL